MAEGNSGQSKTTSLAEERDKKIETLLQVIEGRRGSTKDYLDNLKSIFNKIEYILKRAQVMELEQCKKETRSLKVPFAIKPANLDMSIEKQVIKYIKDTIPRRLELQISFNWQSKDPRTPLVVFCNYSSRIGVDVQQALRGVTEPKVILIILHYARRALLRGDLSDDDYLLPDYLKKKAVCIAHFAFDDTLYDCQQNSQSRNKLCDDLRQLLKVD